MAKKVKNEIKKVELDFDAPGFDFLTYNKTVNLNHRRTPATIIDEIFNMLYQMGYPKVQIVKLLTKKYGVSKAIIYKRLKEVEALVIETQRESVSSDISEILQKMEALYHMTIREGELSTGKSILVEIAKLKGLYVEKSETKIDTTIKIDYVVPNYKKLDNDEEQGM